MVLFCNGVCLGGNGNGRSSQEVKHPVTESLGWKTQGWGDGQPGARRPPPLTKVRQPGPDLAGPELTRPRLGPSQPVCCGRPTSPGPAPAVDGASTAFGWDLVDGGAPSRPENNQNMCIFNQLEIFIHFLF